MRTKSKAAIAEKRVLAGGRRFGATFLNIPYILWAAIFIIVPMLIVAVYAFTDTSGQFTLDNLYKLGIYKQNIIDSFIYALIATVITLLLAYPFAYPVLLAAHFGTPNFIKFFILFYILFASDFSRIGICAIIIATKISPHPTNCLIPIV